MRLNSHQVIILLSSALIAVFLLWISKHQFHNEKDAHPTVSVKTRNTNEVYCGTCFSKRVPGDGKPLRLQFLGNSCDKNSWVEIAGPVLYVDRLEIAKYYAILLGIVTELELAQFEPQARLEIDNKTLVTLYR